MKCIAWTVVKLMKCLDTLRTSMSDNGLNHPLAIISLLTMNFLKRAFCDSVET